MLCDGLLTKWFVVRDTAGTALYFLEYDGMRHMLGRNRFGEQGPTPSWLPVHSSLVPFICGSVSGVSLLDRLLLVDYLTNTLTVPGHVLGSDLSFGRVSAALLTFAFSLLSGHFQCENESSTTSVGR